MKSADSSVTKESKEAKEAKESSTKESSTKESSTKESSTKESKATIPKALREQVWLTHIGRRYEGKCLVRWCKNNMTVHDFHVGHDIPESKGGATELSNLRPICSRCNLSMGSQYSIQEWAKLSAPVTLCCWFC
jgi:5-methylcytosine-specific restriction endonuclease McrA